MDIQSINWVAILSTVIGTITLSVLSNLLTDRVKDWFAKRNTVSKRKRLGSLIKERENIIRFSKNSIDLIVYILSSIMIVILFSLAGSLLFMITRILDLITPSLNWVILAYSGIFVMIISSLRIIFETLTLIKNVNSVDKYLPVLDKRIEEFSSSSPELKQLTIPENIVPENDNIVFFEEFSGHSLNPDVWVVAENTGTVDVSGNTLTLKAQGSNTRFPYVYTRSAVMPRQGNFRVNIGIRFLNATLHGSGVVLAKYIPAYGSEPINCHQAMQLWLDKNKSIPSFLRDNFMTKQLVDVKIDWIDGHVEFTVNDDRIMHFHDVKLDDRPSHIWIGNHVITPESHIWTSFCIHYIKIEKI